MWIFVHFKMPVSILWNKKFITSIEVHPSKELPKYLLKNKKNSISNQNSKFADGCQSIIVSNWSGQLTNLICLKISQYFFVIFFYHFNFIKTLFFSNLNIMFVCVCFSSSLAQRQRYGENFFQELNLHIHMIFYWNVI